MKKLTILLTFLLIGLIGIAQTDTTVVIEKYTIIKYCPEVAYESDWFTIDTIDFDESQDTIFNSISTWRQADSIYVNENIYRIRQIQVRTNDQGIKQKKRRRIKYIKKTIIRRKII